MSDWHIRDKHENGSLIEFMHLLFICMPGVVCVYDCPYICCLCCLCLWLPFGLLSLVSVSMTAVPSTVCVVCAHDFPYIYCLCFPCLWLPLYPLSVFSVSLSAFAATVCVVCVCNCPYVYCLWLPLHLLSVYSASMIAFTSTVCVLYTYNCLNFFCLHLRVPFLLLFASTSALTSACVVCLFVRPHFTNRVFCALNSTVCFFYVYVPPPLQPALSVSMIALTCSVFTVSVYNCAQLSYQFHCPCFCVFIHHTVCVFGVSIDSVWRVCILIALWYKSSPVGIVFWPADLCWLCKRSHGPPHGKHPQSHSDSSISFRARPAYTNRGQEL